MNNEMFRGALIDGTFVYGWLHHLTKNLGRIKAGYYINNRAGSPFAYELRPSTISMKTYQLDKAKEMIYGSFDLEGFGMTKGGDRAKFKDDSGTWQVGNVSTYEEHMKFMLFADDGDDEGNQDKELHPFDIDEVEIIGKQYDEEK